MKKVHYYLIGIFLLAISFFLDDSIANFFVNNKISFFNSLALFIHGIEAYVFFAFVLIVLLAFKQKKEIFPLLVTFVLFIGITNLVKVIVARPRPFTKFPFSDLGETTINRSFPSGHAAGAASVLKFFEFNKILLYFWTTATILIMFSRIYLGMHYLSDVIAGFLLGYFISDLSIFYTKKFKKRN